MKINLKPVFKILPYLCVVGIIGACQQPDTKKQNTAGVGNADTIAHKLPVKAMHDDLAILWSVIKEMHPAYGVFTPPDSLRRTFDHVVSSINEPLTETDFIAHVYPFISNLRCGHTQVKYPAGYKPPGPPPPHLPFEVLVKNHHAWITNHNNNELNTGDEIISMNNTPVAAIISHGYDLYGGDGYNETFKEVFLSEYGGFEDACNKYYHWRPPYHITLRTRQGKLKNLEVNALAPGATLNTTAAKTNDLADWTESKNTDYLPLRFLKNKPTAWFVTRPYQYADTNIYKEAFKEINQRGIKKPDPGYAA